MMAQGSLIRSSPRPRPSNRRRSMRVLSDSTSPCNSMSRLHRVRICVEICPAHSPRKPGTKAINMAAKAPVLAAERNNIASSNLCRKTIVHW